MASIRHCDLLIKKGSRYLCYNSYDPNHWYWGPKHLSEKFYDNARTQAILANHPGAKLVAVAAPAGEATHWEEHLRDCDVYLRDRGVTEEKGAT